MKSWMLLFLATLLAASHAKASVQIATAHTRNMSCTAGVCAPTAKNANLSIRDLRKLLAKSDVTVKTGNGAVTISLSDSLTWATPYRLTLDAIQSIHVRAPIVITGGGGLTLITDDGGTGGDYTFASSGFVTFWDLNSSLVINGDTYVLVGDLKSLAQAVDATPSGHLALASNYDASLEHKYSGPVVPNTFNGTFEGLGNAIQNLAVSVPESETEEPFAGLFQQSGGTLRDIALPNAQVAMKAATGYAGALAVFNFGTIAHASVTGKITGKSYSGGLVGANAGAILQSTSAAFVSGVNAGGLVAVNVATDGTIIASFATGGVQGKSEAGGLAGENQGQIEESFSSGSTSAGLYGGGLVGKNNGGAIAQSYATGPVASAELGGGLVGWDVTEGSIQSAYWDFDTSGISNPSQGAGTPANDPGITGLTDAQLKSGLPAGFDPNVWGQDPNINNGWPYLLANPPQ